MTSPTPATAQDLMDAALRNIQRLQDGETTPAIANGIVNSIAVVLRVVKMQMEYAKMTGKAPSIPMLLTAVEPPPPDQP
jgi:hypothetical protein